MDQNTSNNVFWALFPSPPSFWVVVRDMGIASCKIVPKYVVSKGNQMIYKKEKYQRPKTRRWTFFGPCFCHFRVSVSLVDMAGCGGFIVVVFFVVVVVLPLLMEVRADSDREKCTVHASINTISSHVI
jgi:hypothetical protein